MYIVAGPELEASFVQLPTADGSFCAFAPAIGAEETGPAAAAEELSAADGEAEALSDAEAEDVSDDEAVGEAESEADADAESEDVADMVAVSEAEALTAADEPEPVAPVEPDEHAVRVPRARTAQTAAGARYRFTNQFLSRASAPRDRETHQRGPPEKPDR
ncbi:hypothetical protein V6N00_14470 [Tersicoccus sp. MR15.9]|uniref:hypothetical protein n=1 Tax=Tersicoccus mangrovi TaxID=3121635 RepID=UPI002FE61A97